MKKVFHIILVCFVFVSIISAQEKEERIVITGDSLIGKLINNENVREVIGRVVLKQGGVTITCNKAIQYLSKNEAQLIGNVVAIEDSTTITTEE